MIRKNKIRKIMPFGKARRALGLYSSLSLSFGNNYRNPVITGILRDVLWNLPTLHPKWKVEPGSAVKTDKCPSILGKLVKNAIDNNWGFCQDRGQTGSDFVCGMLFANAVFLRLFGQCINKSHGQLPSKAEILLDSWGGAWYILL